MRKDEPLPRWAPVAAAVVAVIPFLVCHAQLRKFFWFGDEMDLLKESQVRGVVPWLFAPFTESFCPLFKSAAVAVMHFGHGSYLAALGFDWVAHAITVLLFGLLLRRAGFSLPAAACGLVLVALPASNIETLVWSVQSSAVLALTFFMAGLLALDSFDETGERRYLFWLMLASAASALCFARGVLTGVVIAGVCALGLRSRARTLSQRLLPALAALLPALATALVIQSVAQGSHRQVPDWARAKVQLEFALDFFLCNPLQRLFQLETAAGPLRWIGLIKLALIGAGLALASGKKRDLLWMMLALDLGNSLLMGLGRAFTGVGASIGSRYQYWPLFCLAPFVVVLLERLFARLPERARNPAGAALALALTVGVAGNWSREARRWAQWRGTDVRAAIAAMKDSPRLIPYVSNVSGREASELIAKFNLH
jgi:hypothetical protein